jgi:FKBP-type peptidyl-prolyl cis-trans isomerase SlyD
MEKLEEELFPSNFLSNGGYQTGIVTAYSRPVNLELMQKLKPKIAELMHSYGFQDSDIFEEELNALLCSEIGIPLEHIREGTIVKLRTEQGEIRLATIVRVEEDDVTLDFNYPLAGQTIRFEIEIVDLKQ